MTKDNIKSKVSVKDTKKYYVIGSICVFALFLVLLYILHDNTKQVLVQSGRIEETEITTGYIIKKEETANKDASKVLVPVVAEGKKIAKDGIIATYKGEEYANYEEKLKEMDKEILDRMKDLPIVYSSEVDAIDETIYNLVKSSMEETAYNKMQDYKQKINSNINKRATIIGELSPDGAEIKDMIAKRNEYESEAKKSNDNLLAPITGIVTYSTDGLEETLKASDIENLTYAKIKEIVDAKQEEPNTKVKVVNNYEAYIVIKASLDNLKYIEEGYSYTLRLVEENNYELEGTIIKVTKLEDGVEVVFKIANGIENIATLRETEIEVVWDYYEGLYVPNIALKKFEKVDAYYVTAIKYTEYENIPVDIKIQNNNYAIVRNCTEEKLTELGIEQEYSLKLYDRIILNDK